MFRRRITWLIAATLFLTPWVISGDEFRAILVDSWYWGLGYAIVNPAATQQTVDTIKSWNCNVIALEVRKRSDAYYTSSIEPVGTDPSPDPGYDCLADMVAKAHAVGMEVHAWVVPYRVWTTVAPPPHSTPEHIYYLHPEWFSCYADGSTLFDGRYTSLDPGLPQVEDYLIAVFTDIVSRYDIDGFMLDYIRYYGIDWGYNPEAVARFNAEYGRTGSPSSMDPLWQEWRRDQVSNLVKRAYLEIKAVKPHVKVGALVWRTAASGRSEVLQDWDRWMANHWLDYASPMNYTSDNAVFHANSLDSLGRGYGHHIYMGISGRSNPISASVWQIEDARNTGFPGMTFYNYAQPDAGTPNQEGFRDALLAGPYPSPAAIPGMPWLTAPTKGYLKGFIRDETGTPIYPATEFLSERPEAGLVVEADGPTHDYTREGDAIRQEFLESQGLTVMRFANEEVESGLDDVLRQIGEYLRRVGVDAERSEQTFGPEDVFDYIYAVFHSPTYRARYAEFLKMDFPHVPLTSDRELFRRLVEKGAELVSLHLMESPALNNLITKYPVAGSDVVERVFYSEPTRCVWINKDQYFEGIEPAVWGFHIGGYQVLEKWLKDRKGRKLTWEDQQHYQKVVVALKETMRLMSEIDDVIPAWPMG